jgi:hypothetical protein
LGYLHQVSIETIIVLFGLIIGTLLWYGAGKVLLPERADRSPKNPTHQPKGKT